MRSPGSIGFVSGSERKEDLTHLRALLEDEGVAIEPDSDLALAEEIIDQIAEMEMGGVPFLNTAENRRSYRTTAVIAWIAEQIRTASNYPLEFRALREHIKLLAKARKYINFNKGFPQFPADREVNDKLFELQVALGLFPFATDLNLESPQKSGMGLNPDILFTMQDFDPARWGIACKNLRTINQRHFRDQVAAGIEQIQASGVKRGVVFVNLTNVIDHAFFFSVPSDSPETGVLCKAWPPRRSLTEALSRHVSDLLGLQGNDSQAAFTWIRDGYSPYKIQLVMLCSAIAPIILSGKGVVALSNLVLYGDQRTVDGTYQRFFGLYGRISGAPPIVS